LPIPAINHSEGLDTVTTATPKGAQAHARQQGDTVIDTMPTLPPSRHADPPNGVAPAQLTWVEIVAGGGYTSVYLDRGATLQLTDIDGDACAHVLLYNARQPAERLNVADTIKVQWQAYLASGAVLLSDLGRALATITRDTSGHHDALCGTSTRLTNAERYGDGAAQGPAPAGRELFKLAGAKHGLEARDVAPSISFFQGVRADESGRLSFVGSAGAGTVIEVVAEMPLLALIVNVAHPLDARVEYTCTKLGVAAWCDSPQPVGERSPEMVRALLNTTSYLASRGEMSTAMVGAR
jgi:urea carboxylase-associated protein 2